MKNLLIAAALVGTAVAGIILYLKDNPSTNKKLYNSADRRVDGEVRNMKFSMG